MLQTINIFQCFKNHDPFVFFKISNLVYWNKSFDVAELVELHQLVGRDYDKPRSYLVDMTCL